MKSIKIIVAGDILPSEGNIDLFEKGDAKTLFGKEICQLFAASDYSIVNLEGPLTDCIIPQQKNGPVIKAPMSTILGIKNLGVSAVAMANNHLTDYLQQGLIDTIKVIQNAGLEYVGVVSYNGQSKISRKYLSFKINEYSVCIYNVSETFFNSPSKDMDGANVYDEWIVLNEIKDLKKNHDYLIVIYHGGAEYLPFPTPKTRTRFHRMAECGADFITAQHTHCIGCEEWYKGSYLLYGQGNFLFARQKMYPMLTKEGLVTEIIITEQGFTVNNHKVNIIGNLLSYDKFQDLAAFKKRSSCVDNTEFIIEQYQELKTNEIMREYLIAAKGGYPFQRITKRLFPNSVKHPESTYSRKQILRNIDVLQGERRCEDMYYVWKYLLDNYPQD